MKEVHRVLGIIQYYRDVWPRCSHTLVSLTSLVGGQNSKNSNKKIEWTKIHKSAFDEMKKIVSHNVLLAYARFDQPFIIHTDASDYQLGSVISQDAQPLAFSVVI